MDGETAARRPDESMQRALRLGDLSTNHQPSDISRQDVKKDRQTAEHITVSLFHNQLGCQWNWKGRTEQAKRTSSKSLCRILWRHWWSRRQAHDILFCWKQIHSKAFPIWVCSAWKQNNSCSWIKILFEIWQYKKSTTEVNRQSRNYPEAEATWWEKNGCIIYLIAFKMSFCESQGVCSCKTHRIASSSWPGLSSGTSE